MQFSLSYPFLLPSPILSDSLSFPWFMGILKILSQFTKYYLIVYYIK